MSLRRKVLALDAMGVIYAEANDGPNLLYPFIVNHGGCRDIPEVIRLYSLASQGKISSAEFWNQAGVDPALEDTYLLQHRLSVGLIDFLNDACALGFRLWCLSNDVSEWSRKLRRRFELDRYLQGYVISGDVGSRKPNPAIYRCLMDQTKADPSEIIFVDDRLRNAKAADALGITSILFNPSPEDSQGHEYKVARNFSEILSQYS
jgi:HAD superfamily hydrolase (TIGR01509 family)